MKLLQPEHRLGSIADGRWRGSESWIIGKVRHGQNSRHMFNETLTTFVLHNKVNIVEIDYTHFFTVSGARGAFSHRCGVDRSK